MMTYILRSPRNNHIVVLTILAFLAMCMGPAKKEVAPPNQTIIAALIEVESGGRDSAIGDKGKAVGCLQIHPGMIDEVNRISKAKKTGKVFNLSDRTNRAKSVEIFIIYTNYYTPTWEPETVARRWNGGPEGDKKRATLPYWAKVRPIFERLTKESQTK